LNQVDPSVTTSNQEQVSPILVVGGNLGIGAALVEQLQADGRTVMTMNRQSQPPVDVTSLDPLPAISGPLSGLVYCPGSLRLAPFDRLKLDDFRADLEINLLGAVRVIQEYVGLLKESGNGSIVLFSTVAVQRGMPFHASIAAAKGAVEGLTRSLAAELAPSIRVNAIAPSLTETSLTTSLLRSERQRAAAEQRHPLKRFGQAHDIASAARYLLSAESSWVTGQVLAVDGGLSVIERL